MSVLTIYADTNDDWLLYDTGGAYATAIEANGYAAQGAGRLAMMISQNPGYFRLCQAGVRFDSSPLGSGASISASVVSMCAEGAIDSTSRYVEAFVYDWGASFVGADARLSSQINALTMVAKRQLTSLSDGTRYDWTDVAMVANTNKTGYTYLVCTEDYFRLAEQPTTNHWVSFKDADTSGTTSDPTLTVTYTTSTTYDAAGDLTGGGTFAGTVGLNKQYDAAGDLTGGGTFAGTLTKNTTYDAAGGLTGGGTFTGALSLLESWIYGVDGVSAMIDVAGDDPDGTGGLGPTETASYLVEAFSDALGDINGATLIASRVVVVSGSGAGAPALAWRLPGVVVEAPALASDLVTITLFADGTVGTNAVKLYASLNTGSPTPADDISTLVSPALSLTNIVAASTPYTYATAFPRTAPVESSILITLAVRADLVDAAGTILDTRTIYASWYGGGFM